MDGSGGGIIVLVIIGIVLNMIIKAMRAKPPTQQRPPQTPDQPTMGQDVSQPYEDRPAPQPVRTPQAMAPRVKPANPAVDPTKGVSLEGFSAETPAMGTVASQDKPAPDVAPPVDLANARGTILHPIKEWFRGDGVIRGIVMSEVLGPPVSRRR